ncbi:hypothetical protein HK097_003260, partial [Rhizophlyctis rosea]
FDKGPMHYVHETAEQFFTILALTSALRVLTVDLQCQPVLELEPISDYFGSKGANLTELFLNADILPALVFVYVAVGARS